MLIEHSVTKADNNNAVVVDVDGSYLYILYKKYKLLSEEGKQVALLAYISPPISGWKAITESNYQSFATVIPTVTSGI